MCRFYRYKQGLDGHRWARDSCGFRKSMREGSFFERSHLTLEQIITIVYLWFHDSPQKYIIHKVEVDEKPW